MELLLPLLGHVNPSLPTDAPLRPKYVVKVTAEQLQQFLQYERKGPRKLDPFRILPSSLIKIDREIQRGVDGAGYQLQQPSKVLDIAATLLGQENASVPRAYLGALTWNIRHGDFTLTKQERDGKPPEYKLEIVTDAIYLTDSAHRHFGIAEACRLYADRPQDYPKFRKNFEFSVEIYNLDRAGEKELFSELNSKQKKITAAKQKEMDVSSPIGALKDAIVQYDQEHANLLSNNIEVSSNRNDKHTLMTMSVFVASVAAMYQSGEIREARGDEDIRADYAAYYCAFLEQLHECVIVRCDLLGDGKETDVRPFSNLYREHIQPVVDSYTQDPGYETEVEKAQNIAASRNQALRKLDIANHNATIKALFGLGGTIRTMPHWQRVIERLQTQLLIPADGHFFQRDNTELFSKDSDADVPIASVNKDGSINVQVQTKTISKLTAYLRRKLSLTLDPQLYVGTGEDKLPIAGSLSPSRAVSREHPTTWVFEFSFIGVRALALEVEPRLALDLADPKSDWKAAVFKGAKRLSPKITRISPNFEHSAYPEDLVRWVAYFEVSLPAAPIKHPTTLTLTVTYPDYDGSESQPFEATIVAVAS